MISFNVKEAGDYLLKNGMVYTMRKKRHEGWTDLFVNHDYRGWCNVELIGAVNEIRLESYVLQSGFPDLRSWADEARRIHASDPASLYVYKVTLGKEEYGAFADPRNYG